MGAKSAGGSRENLEIDEMWPFKGKGVVPTVRLSSKGMAF